MLRQGWRWTKGWTVAHDLPIGALMKKEQLPRIRLRRYQEARTSILTINHPYATLELRIRAKTSPQHRRTVAVALCRQLRPWVENAWAAYLEHADRYSNHWRDEERGIFLADAVPVSHPEGSLGFRIRMRRLDFGWKQEVLAQRTGLSVCRISRIERGKIRPRGATLKILEIVLGIPIAEALKRSPVERGAELSREMGELDFEAFTRRCQERELLEVLGSSQKIN